MQAGLGILGWPPSEFWASTIPELVCGIKGWRIANGHAEPESDPVLGDEFEEMKKRDDLRRSQVNG